MANNPGTAVSSAVPSFVSAPPLPSAFQEVRVRLCPLDHGHHHGEQFLCRWSQLVLRVVGELRVPVVLDEPSLLQAPKGPIQRAVSQVVVSSTWPASAALLRPNGVEENRVLQRSAMKSRENIPSPFTSYQVAGVVNSLQESIIIWRQTMLRMSLRLLDASIRLPLSMPV